MDLLALAACWRDITAISGISMRFRALLKTPRINDTHTLSEMGVYDTELAVAIEQNDVVAARLAIDNIVQINFQTIERRAALYLAVKHNNVAVAGMLLARKAKMNVMPRIAADKTICQSPMLAAFRLGESHEEMQLLFLHELKSVCHTWLSPSDRSILGNIRRYAMVYSTPRVFFAASGDIGATCVSHENGLNPLMFTLKKVAMLESNPVACTRIMRNVLQILNTCPAMAWERLAEADDCGKLMHTAGSTALGMLVFEIMQYRRSTNQYFETLSATLKSLHDTVEMAVQDSVDISEVLSGIRNQNNTDLQNNTQIDKDMQTVFIPELFTLMLRPMRFALCMANHARLGSKDACFAGGLSTDIIDMIFKNLLDDIGEAPHLLKDMLCP